MERHIESIEGGFIIIEGGLAIRATVDNIHPMVATSQLEKADRQPEQIAPKPMKTQPDRLLRAV